MAMVITFAGFDWLMSLNPIWFSTIFGVYYFAGSFISTFSILIIVTTLARDPGARISTATSSAPSTCTTSASCCSRFICFWGYIGLLADDADLDRQPARGDPVLHGAHEG